MNGVLIAQPGWPLWPYWSRPLWRHGQALAFTLALHALLLLALLLADWPQPAPTMENRTIRVQLARLPPPPVPAVAPMAAAPAAIAMPQAPAASAKPPAKPRNSRPKAEPAALARQRIARQQAQQQRQQQARDQQLRQQVEAAQRQQQQAAAAEQQQAAAAEQQQAMAAERARQAAASRPYLPLTKQPPAYPQRALDKGIEGDCTVSYSVNAEGRVENPVASAACHPLFVRPSLAAARAFRYQPRLVDGRAVAVPNASNTFEYRIE